jgi:hypothetical protein
VVHSGRCGGTNGYAKVVDGQCAGDAVHRRRRAVSHAAQAAAQAPGLDARANEDYAVASVDVARVADKILVSFRSYFPHGGSQPVFVLAIKYHSFNHVNAASLRSRPCSRRHKLRDPHSRVFFICFAIIDHPVILPPVFVS